ncbi:MAG: nitroreductase family deazaflavin-dependent oxidoreductase [Deltaproteobacteria bacterium]|nr:nitroreductase family deazaflavin-dependent oxidoreductase [Deltaproteobacteria bacterium]
MKTSHVLIELTKRMPWLPVAIVKGQRWVYDITRGRLMTTIEGSAICVVTMTGARTGKKYKWPLMYVPYEDGVLLVASRGGASENPAWYWNLLANPDIEVHFEGRHMHLQARQAGPVEKAELWPVCIAAYPSYGDYQSWTSRDIPVFICLPNPSNA